MADCVFRSAHTQSLTHSERSKHFKADSTATPVKSAWAYACVCAPEEEVLSIVTCQPRLNEELRGHKQLPTVSETLDGFVHRIFASVKYPFQLSVIWIFVVQRLSPLKCNELRTCSCGSLVCVRFCFLFSRGEASSYSSHTKSACWKQK